MIASILAVFRAQTKLMKLESDCIDTIMQFADQEKSIKDYFRKQVLPLIDRTIVFTSKKCSSCFHRMWIEKARFIREGVPSKKYLPYCMSCHRMHRGETMMSAHNAINGDFKTKYILDGAGVDAWIESLYQHDDCLVYNWVTKEYLGMRSAVMTAFHHDCSRLANHKGAELIRKMKTHESTLERDELKRLRPSLCV